MCSEYECGINAQLFKPIRHPLAGSFICDNESLLCRIFAVTCRKQLMLLLVVSSASFQFIAGQKDDVIQIFQNCHKRSPDFDSCVKRAFNDLIVFFKTGIPELGIAPFDPHRSPYVEQRRGITDGLGGYRLRLTDVSEFGWASSKVTKYKTDAENNRFIYSQDFPEKSLTGFYDFKASVLGRNIHTKGDWNITLLDYSQTTSVTRVGGPGSTIKVRIEIDKLGGMQLKVSDMFNGRKVIENTADFLINTLWQPGFPFVKPLINDLISSAFTDIFNDSFRYLNVDEFISE